MDILVVGYPRKNDMDMDMDMDGIFLIHGKPVNNKWTWITNDTPENTCRDRISEMCLSVRKAIGGIEFIQNTVIKELKDQIQQIDKGSNTTISKFNPEFHKKMAKVFYVQSDNSMNLKVGGILFKHKISIRSMRLLLRSTLLSTKEMNRFKEKYNNPDERVSIEEILKFLASES
ncbi:hypothetical protein LOD99_10201 [Oopsacas minuta]|uniref:Uncharacterized protein n=1 Tax=Oopsacas minuta TaxID=111878 RepID=A0AAV7KKC5_9METZ|nr:hypothetical protein LOD99_10201 [Oopsacas minuta]